eukprot:TRINITY_DN2177_c0_g1_i1.p1 TRINITY_DN2177_c0_g1~~TRINITY_DN2177_c0_g1_i1.p1  ORF type:complete len:122 (-),score=29.46 TRINITY_DN2177_c0_g1_i1:22-366(-)
MLRRPPRSTRKESSAASDVYKRQVNNMSPKECENFLQFCTGCRRVPAGGFKGLNEGANRITPFKITPGSSDRGYVLAHTCFNTIELPMYKDLETMEKYVKEIVNSPKSFQFTSE